MGFNSAMKLSGVSHPNKAYSMAVHKWIADSTKATKTLASSMVLTWAVVGIRIYALLNQTSKIEPES